MEESWREGKVEKGQTSERMERGGSQGNAPGHHGCLHTGSSLCSRETQVSLFPSWTPHGSIIFWQHFSFPSLLQTHIWEQTAQWLQQMGCNSPAHLLPLLLDETYEKSKAAPNGQDQAWYPQLYLGVLLKNRKTRNCLNHKIPTVLSPDQHRWRLLLHNYGTGLAQALVPKDKIY